MLFNPGAQYLGHDTCRFRVWAPHADEMSLHLWDAAAVHPMLAVEAGFFELTLQGILPGTHYLDRFPSGVERPDPASASQPRGVHGPSEVVDPGFHWTDRMWRGLPREEYILYELHTGTFTSEGTFDAIVPRLDQLVDLGITALELMPVAAFAGGRNWGYDGVFPYAVQAGYGGPVGLKRLLDACHGRGLAVVLDVVYNHLGPEGNYLGEFGPYFNPLHHTPWGSSLNFDAAGSEPVRAYFVENALRWITEFHIDALRLDAIHAMHDESAAHILQEIAQRVQGRGRALGRHIHVLAESDLNQLRVIQPPDHGLGMDAQWSDDFHHSLPVALTGESNGYYGAYSGFTDVVKAWSEGFVYSGQYSPHRQRHHGTSSADIEPSRLIVFSQNHDQIGNRFLGERLAHLADFESAKLAAAAVILSPYLPLLLMGEEYGETGPFQYFVSHGDPELIEAVRRGRREEFRHFYRELLWLRRGQPALTDLRRNGMALAAFTEERVLSVTGRSEEGPHIRATFNFNSSPVSLASVLRGGDWYKLLDSADRIWEGPGSEFPKTMSPRSAAVLASEAAFPL